MVSEGAELLPENAVLLHIGPFKTGSTALQAALFAAKPELGRYGVAYPGVWRRIVGAGYAALGTAPRGRELPPISVWENFAAQVRKRDQLRVCVSTEDFSNVTYADRFPKIIADLGADRVQIVTVARAFHRLLPSSWQQTVKEHGTQSYEEWLHEVLDQGASGPARDYFWNIHDIERTAAAWLPLVGQDRFRVVVADDNDPRYLLTIFEQLLGLPGGLLELTEAKNASLTESGAELLRLLNDHFDKEGWSDELYFTLIQSGLIYGLQAASATQDQRLRNLPPWALARARELTEHRIRVLQNLGEAVIGDLDRLRAPDDYVAAAEESAESVISIDSMVSGLVRLLSSAVRREERLRQVAGKASAEPAATSVRPAAPKTKNAVAPRLSDYDSGALLAELSRRVRRRVRQTVRR